MKFFLNNGSVHAFSKNDDPSWYKGMKEITPQQAQSIANPEKPIIESLARVKQYMRTKRSPLLDAINGIGWRAGRYGDDAVADEAITLSIALLDITDDEYVNKASNYDEMKSAADSAFHKIATSASEAFDSVFRNI